MRRRRSCLVEAKTDCTVSTPPIWKGCPATCWLLLAAPRAVGLSDLSQRLTSRPFCSLFLCIVKCVDAVSQTLSNIGFAYLKSRFASAWSALPDFSHPPGVIPPSSPQSPLAPCSLNPPHKLVHYSSLAIAGHPLVSSRGYILNMCSAHCGQNIIFIRFG